MLAAAALEILQHRQLLERLILVAAAAVEEWVVAAVQADIELPLGLLLLLGLQLQLLWVQGALGAQQAARMVVLELLLFVMLIRMMPQLPQRVLQQLQ